MATIETIHSSVAVMIDLETLALQPRAYVTQVGICIADTKTREYFLKPTNFWMHDEDVAQEDRLIDISTVRFWMGQAAQHPETALGVFNCPEGTQPIYACELFRYFDEVMKAHPNCMVWASPGMFDLAMLTDLWGSKPWKYSQERDMMTLYKLLDPDGIHRPEPNGKEHDAASDAGWQMEYLFELLDLLRNNEMVQHV
jgi:hypothetical protein